MGVGVDSAPVTSPPLRPEGSAGPPPARPSGAALAALGGGALLAALELPLEVSLGAAGALEVGAALRASGALLVTGGLTAARGLPPAPATTSAAGLAALWATLALLDAIAPASPRSAAYLLGPLLEVGALLAAALAAARAFMRQADAAGWSDASHAWRRAHLASLIALYAAGLALGAGLVVSLARGASLDPGSWPLARLFGPVLLAWPALAVAAACAWTARARAQRARVSPPPLARLATHPLFPSLGLLALLAVAWAGALPAVVHHVRTPSFGEYVATRPGAARAPGAPAGVVRLGSWQGPTWSEGAPVPEPEALPAGVAVLVQRVELRLAHGAERLLEVDLEVACAFDAASGALRGARQRVLRAACDPRFNLVVHTQLDADGERLGFSSWVGLASGMGDLRLGGLRVRGLPPVLPDADGPALARHEAADLAELPFAPARRPRLRLAGRACGEGDRLPPVGEGLQYGGWVRGALAWQPGYTAEQAARLATRIRWFVNTHEYAFSVETVERLRAAGPSGTAPEAVRRQRLLHERAWNGSVW